MRNAVFFFTQIKYSFCQRRTYTHTDMSTAQHYANAAASRLPEIPRPAPPNLKKDSSAYVCACAALGIKPNSRVVAMGEAALTGASRLDFTNNYIGGAGFQALSVVLLGNNTALERLVVAGNGLSNESVVHFCRQMMTSSPSASSASASSADGSVAPSSFPCPNLRVVDFSNNPLSLPAATALLQFANINPTIEEIYLEGTNIDAATLRKIGRCLNLKRTRGQRRRAASSSSSAQTTATPPPHAHEQHNQQPITPYGKAFADQKVRAADIRAALRAKRAEAEAERAATVAPLLVDGMRRAILQQQQMPIPRSFGGFTVINVAIASTPSDFVSELRMIYDVIIPSLNRQFGPAYGLLLNPTSMFVGCDPHAYGPAQWGASSYCDGSSSPAVPPVFTASIIADIRKAAAKGTAVASESSSETSPSVSAATTTNANSKATKRQSVAITADFVRHIAKGAPFFVQLIGDTIGLPRYDPSLAPRRGQQATTAAEDHNDNNNNSTNSNTDDADEGKSNNSSGAKKKKQINFSPIAHYEYEVGCATAACAIAMIRAPAPTLGVPAPLLPRLSDSPYIAFADEHTRAVREAVAAVGGDAPRSFFDIDVERQKWAEHSAFVAKVKATHSPPELLCADYTAAFDSVDRHGNILLKGLDGNTNGNDGNNSDGEGSAVAQHRTFASMLTTRLSAGLNVIASLLHGTTVNGVAAHRSAAAAPTAADAERSTVADSTAAQSSLHFFATPPSPADGGATVLSARMPRLLAAASASANAVSTPPLGRKAIISRLDLYAVTPPSRNMTLLCATAGGACGVSATLRAFAAKCLARPKNYIVAHHSARDGHLFAEPSDQKTMFLSLMQQLAFAAQHQKALHSSNSNATAYQQMAAVPYDLIPSYIVNEVSIDRIREHFAAALARASGDAGDRQVIMLIIDGLDELDPAVAPAASLRISETGANTWDPSSTSPAGAGAGVATPKPPATSAAASSSRPTSAVSPGTPLTPTPPSAARGASSSSPQLSLADDAVTELYSFIPICLPRNVRLVGSCQSHSAAHKHLAARGHDSCDAISVGAIADAEVEAFLGTITNASNEADEKKESVLSAETRAAIVANPDAHSYGYLQLIAAACDRFAEAPTAFTSADAAASAVPPTQRAACEALMDELEAELGEPLVRKALSLLLISRWGLTEMELSALLVAGSGGGLNRNKQRAAIAAGGGNNNGNGLPSRRPVRSAVAAAGATHTSPPSPNPAPTSTPPPAAGVGTANTTATSANMSTNSSSVLAGDILLKFIRLMRPVLAPTAATTASSSSAKKNPYGPAAGATELVVSIANRTFRAAATERYLRDPLSAHQQMAHFYRRIVAAPSATAAQSSSASPSKANKKKQAAAASSLPADALSALALSLKAKALVECAYHVTTARLWPLLNEWVLTVAFVSHCYAHRCGHGALRELLRAYNAIDAATAAQCPPSERSVLLAKAREYCYFARDHSVNLTLFPHMGYQIAITSAHDTFLHRDAAEHFAATATKRPYFSATAKSKAKAHREAITALCFAPSGTRFATCADDRAVSIFTAGGDKLFTANNSGSKMKRLVYSASSRYLVGVAEDRTVFVYDAANATLVSKFHGHNSVVRDVAMSCRGRFVATCSDDRTLKIWEAETGALCVSVPHSAFAPSTAIAAGSAGFGVSRVAPDPYDEFVFYVACHKSVVGWRMNGARTSCEMLFSVEAHATRPIASLCISADAQFLVTCAGHPAYDERSGASAAAGGGASAVAEPAARIWRIGGVHVPPTAGNDAAKGGAAATITHVADLELPPPQPANASGASPLSPLVPNGPLAHHGQPRGSFAAGNGGALLPQAGSAFCALSPDEGTVAVALVDGTVCAYAIRWSALLPSSSPNPSSSTSTAVATILPAGHFSCFAHHPSIHIQHLVFSHDGGMLAVTGNTRQIKVVNVRTNRSSTRRGDGVSGNEEEGGIDVANAMVAEYLLEAPLTALAWSPCPQEGAPEVLIGDSAGRLHSLRLERPDISPSASNGGVSDDE